MAPPPIPPLVHTIADLLSISRIPSDPSSFMSVHPPQPMGNSDMRIAYGGCTLGVAAAAACATVPAGFHPYSLLGNFLGPANVEQRLRAEVRSLRDTRAFRTRHVLVYQAPHSSAGGAERLVLSMLADFHAPEPATELVFSAGPRGSPAAWGGPEDAKSSEQIGRELVAAGRISDSQLRQGLGGFELASRFFDCRHAPGSVLGERLLGIVKGGRTTQGDAGRALHEMISADWVRVPQRLHGETEHVVALAALMDMAVGFLPLSYHGKFLDDVGSCSSLDFALRLFVERIDMNEWSLRELMAISGAAGRTYSEARLYDRHGNLIAAMNQQAILRPKPTSKL